MSNYTGLYDAICKNSLNSNSVQKYLYNPNKNEYINYINPQNGESVLHLATRKIIYHI